MLHFHQGTVSDQAQLSLRKQEMNEAGKLKLQVS